MCIETVSRKFPRRGCKVCGQQPAGRFSQLCPQHQDEARQRYLATLWI